MGKDAALSMLAGTPSVANPSIMTPGVSATSAPTEAVADTNVPHGTTLDSDRFAHLAAKEAQLVKQREQYKSEQQKLYEEKQKLKSVKDQIDKFQALQKQDPVAALKEIGFKEEDILNFLADKQPEEQTPEQKIALAAQAEVQKLRDEMKAKEDADLKARDDRAINGYKNEIGKTITKEADKFKFLNHYGPIAEDLVYETILEITRTEENINPHEIMKEALELVENHYMDDYQAKVKFMTPKQIEEAVQAPLPPQRTRTIQAPVNPVDKPVHKPAPTLTSRATATIAGSIPKPETKAQKRDRLESILRGGWQK